MIPFVRRLDERAESFFEELRGDPALDRLFYAASALGEFSLLWVLLALARGLRRRPCDRRAAARALVAVPIESFLVNVVVKSLFARRRPGGDVVHPHRFRQPLTSSFPSGHATAASCAVVLLSEDDALAPLYVGAAAVVASSRVYTKVHHASDVAAGLVLGTFLGIVGRCLAPLGGRQRRRKGRR